MADKLLFPTTGISSAGSIVATPVGIASVNGWSVEIAATLTAFTGAFKFELSNGGENWFDITAQMVPVITQPSTTTGAYGFIAGAGVSVPPAELLRVTLTWSAGTAAALKGWLSAVRR